MSTDRYGEREEEREESCGVIAALIHSYPIEDTQPYVLTNDQFRLISRCTFSSLIIVASCKIVSADRGEEIPGLLLEEHARTALLRGKIARAVVHSANIRADMKAQEP